MLYFWVLLSFTKKDTGPIGPILVQFFPLGHLLPLRKGIFNFYFQMLIVKTKKRWQFLRPLFYLATLTNFPILDSFLWEALGFSRQTFTVLLHSPGPLRQCSIIIKEDVHCILLIYNWNNFSGLSFRKCIVGVIFFLGTMEPFYV